MPLLGQASGGWTESSSALRILNVGVRNTVGVLVADAFTQTNPTAVTTNVTTRVDQTLTGVLSGSVCFIRPDGPGGGANIIGGAGSNAVQTAIRAAAAQQGFYRPLGVFINSANGNSFENTPGTASGKGPYVSSQGTYGNALYETAFIGDSIAGDPAAGAAVTYRVGARLIASRNGFLMCRDHLNAAAAALIDADDITVGAESFVRNADAQATTIGILKMPPDATQTELVYDQRI